MSLPLFPDLLERADYQGRFRDYLHRGHGVWPVGESTCRVHSDDLSEYRHLAVIYDDERFSFKEHRTGKPWIVEITRYFHEYRMIETGWGSSRRKERKLICRSQISERRFATRDEAIELAEKLIEIIRRINDRDENPVEEPEPIEGEADEEANEQED